MFMIIKCLSYTQCCHIFLVK